MFCRSSSRILIKGRAQHGRTCRRDHVRRRRAFRECFVMSHILLEITLLDGTCSGCIIPDFLALDGQILVTSLWVGGRR
jgi:hypothetical protein